MNYRKKTVTQLSYEIVGAAIHVHKELGPGLLESVYEVCLKYELESRGFQVHQQLRVPLIYEGLAMDINLKVDLLVDDLIVVELKCVNELLPVHEAQIISYLKLLKKPQGLLINFYTDNITKALKPFVGESFNYLKE